MAQLFDIAVVGMGPVGATGAILLADAGLSVAVFERDKVVHPLPRAVGMDGEMIRAFQGVGREEELVALLQGLRPGARAGFADSNRKWMFGADLTDFGPGGWPVLSMFDQPEIDGHLRDTATAHENVTSFIGYEVTDLENGAEQVAITARDSETGEQVTCAARYLIGCDGAGSFVRQSMDIQWEDLGYNQDWLVVDVTVTPEATLTNEVLQVCDPDRIVTYVATKDPYRRWEFRLNPGETREEMLKEEAIHKLLDEWTPRETYEVRRAAVYQFHAVVADRWRDGRIFLAGDAAHQTPPFLGQGMNAGVRDVINLSWKLPLVLSGASPDSLLDTYFDERAEHSKDLIDWAVTIGRLMEFFAATEAAARTGTPPPDDAPSLSAAYGQGRSVPPLRGGLLLASQVTDEGSTGYQISQPIVRSRDGSEFRLDEALGTGFALVAKTANDFGLTPEGQDLADQLGVKCVALDEYTCVKGEFDNAFETAAAVLVRPDRYIFGHTDEQTSASWLVQELARLLTEQALPAAKLSQPA